MPTSRQCYQLTNDHTLIIFLMVRSQHVSSATVNVHRPMFLLTNDPILHWQSFCIVNRSNINIIVVVQCHAPQQWNCKCTVILVQTEYMTLHIEFSQSGDG